MATIKLKYNPSAREGKEGVLFFQIIHQRQVKRIYPNVNICDEEWDAEHNSVIIPSTADAKRIKYLVSVNESLKECLTRLIVLIAGFEAEGFRYTVQDVANAFNDSRTAEGVVWFMRRLIEEMRKIGKRSAVKRFKATLNSILRYTQGNEVDWKDVTPTFILGYEEFLMKCGLCRNSTSFYMRNLRTIFNRATEQNFKTAHNLFKHVYMGVDKTVKRAVALDTIRRIRDIDLSAHPSLDFARKVFMFAFYTRGMSFIDIAFLKKKDISNGVLTYSRSKTKQHLSVRIEPATRNLIDSFGNNETSFLLPIITDEYGDYERQYENAYYRVNRNIRKVGEMLGLETKLTLYVARHAWASIAHSNNVSVSTISKAMGHDSERTTIIYLQSLDSSSVDKANGDIIRMMDDGNIK